jgi:hypothetical protein
MGAYDIVTLGRQAQPEYNVAFSDEAGCSGLGWDMACLSQESVTWHM